MAAPSSSAVLVPPPGGTNAAAPTAPAAVSPADLRDLKPPVALPWGWAWLAWTLLAAVLLAAAYAAWRRWFRPVPGPGPTIVIPPHVRARDRLRQALAFLTQPKTFCTLVSDALRQYLEERFDFHAPERTTEEFMAELHASFVLTLAQKQSLADFLARCDLVKFARYEPVEPELRDLYDAAVRLVEGTEPVLAPPAPPAAPSAPTPRMPRDLVSAP